jgi:hypothetical protein
MSMVVVHVASSARNILVFLGRMAEAMGHALHLHYFRLEKEGCYIRRLRGIYNRTSMDEAQRKGPAEGPG